MARARASSGAVTGSSATTPPAAPARRSPVARARDVTAPRLTLRRDTDGSLSARDADDLRLAGRAAAGDRDSAVVLYRRYVGEIYGYFWNQTANSQDAEDLTSETFLRVVRSLGEFEGRATFRTWLYEIARNQLKDFWRLRSRRPVGVPLESTELVSAGDPADERPVAEPSAPDRRTQAILDSLPETYRQVLTLRILDGRSVKDTAEVMGKTENHVKVLTHRALKLAARFGDTTLESGPDRAPVDGDTTLESGPGRAPVDGAAQPEESQ